MFDIQNEGQLAGITNLHLLGARGSCPNCFISLSIFPDDMKTERFRLHKSLKKLKLCNLFSEVA